MFIDACVVHCSTIPSWLPKILQFPVTPQLRLRHRCTKTRNAKLDHALAVFRIDLTQTVNLISGQVTPFLHPAASRWENQFITHDSTRKHVSITRYQVLTVMTGEVNPCKQSRWIGGINKSSFGSPHSVLTLEDFLY